MADLRDKVENALNECRMLALGIQVLIGFGMQAVLEKQFRDLPFTTRFAEAAGLMLNTCALVVILLPAAYHQLAERGEITRSLYRSATAAAAGGLLLFAVGIGMKVYVALVPVLDSGVLSMALGTTAFGTAMLLWYGYGYRCRALPRNKKRRDDGNVEEVPTTLAERIKQVLVEIRVALPGVQALLAFSFSATLMEGFHRLPLLSKAVHLTGIGWVCLSMILLMTPPAYHRVALEGEDSNSFLRLAGRFLLAAMGALAIGLACGLYVVVQANFGSPFWAAVAGGVGLLIMLLGWFVFPVAAARRRRPGRIKRKPGSR